MNTNELLAKTEKEKAEKERKQKQKIAQVAYAARLCKRKAYWVQAEESGFNIIIETSPYYAKKYYLENCLHETFFTVNDFTEYGITCKRMPQLDKYIETWHRNFGDTECFEDPLWINAMYDIGYKMYKGSSIENFETTEEHALNIDEAIAYAKSDERNKCLYDYPAYYLK